jgi:DNA/RNA endonuclease G (NUC1)
MYHPGTKCPIVREVLHAGNLIRNVDTKKHQGYRQDPRIPQENRGALVDYKGTQNVILGHARPRADAYNTDQGLYDVGYLTNIMAQDPTLNNGLWKKLEKTIRNDWTRNHLCLHVYTGGVFTTPIDVKGPKTITHSVIGLNEVHVPTHLFKVIYVYDYGIGWRSCAYLIPNIPLKAAIDLNQYIVPVKRIQEISGVDFLGKYP